MNGRLVQLSETNRKSVEICVDGKTVSALDGDSVLIAMLRAGNRLGASEFGGGARAGFCLMGACQDCWVWAETGRRVRACTTGIAEGDRFFTVPPELR